jgi:hypothetical protein
LKNFRAFRAGSHHARDIEQVIDLVHASLHALERVEDLRHMAGDAHAQAMSFGGNRLDHLRCQVCVELDLAKPGGVIAIHHRATLLGRLGGDVAEGFQTSCVDQSREQQPRTDSHALLDGVTLRDQVIELAAAIARRRDARSQERGSELDTRKMRVHLPQSGQQGLAFRIHDGHVGRNRDLAARPGRADSSIADDYDGVGNGRRAGCVDQRRAGNGEGSRVLRWNLTRDRREIGHLLLHAATVQLR